MTRHGFVPGIALTFALTACGGSSSETPPPLQPDPKGFHYAGVSASAPETTDAGSAPLAADPDDEDKPRAPARPTWGGNTPHH